MKVTYGELAMLDHFHNDRGDVTRWCGWEEFKNKHPEVKQAYDQMENSRKIFELVIKGLETEDE